MPSTATATAAAGSSVRRTGAKLKGAGDAVGRGRRALTGRGGRSVGGRGRPRPRGSGSKSNRKRGAGSEAKRKYEDVEATGAETAGGRGDGKEGEDHDLKQEHSRIRDLLELRMPRCAVCGTDWYNDDEDSAGEADAGDEDGSGNDGVGVGRRKRKRRRRRIPELLAMPPCRCTTVLVSPCAAFGSSAGFRLPPLPASSPEGDDADGGNDEEGEDPLRALSRSVTPRHLHNVSMCRPCLSQWIESSERPDRYDYRDPNQPMQGYSIDPKCVQCKVKYTRRKLDAIVEGRDGGGSGGTGGRGGEGRRRGGSRSSGGGGSGRHSPNPSGGADGDFCWEDAVTTTVEVVRYLKCMRRRAAQGMRARGESSASEKSPAAAKGTKEGAAGAGTGAGQGAEGRGGWESSILDRACPPDGHSSDECFTDSDMENDMMASDYGSASASSFSSLHPARRQLSQKGELMEYLIERDPRFKQEQDDLRTLREKLQTAAGRAELDLTEEDARAAAAGFGLGAAVAAAAGAAEARARTAAEDERLAKRIAERDEDEDRRRRRRQAEEDARIAREMERDLNRSMDAALRSRTTRASTAAAAAAATKGANVKEKAAEAAWSSQKNGKRRASTALSAAKVAGGPRRKRVRPAAGATTAASLGRGNAAAEVAAWPLFSSSSTPTASSASSSASSASSLSRDNESEEEGHGAAEAGDETAAASLSSDAEATPIAPPPVQPPQEQWRGRERDDVARIRAVLSRRGDGSLPPSLVTRRREEEEEELVDEDEMDEESEATTETEPDSSDDDMVEVVKVWKPRTGGAGREEGGKESGVRKSTGPTSAAAKGPSISSSASPSCLAEDMERKRSAALVASASVVRDRLLGSSSSGSRSTDEGGGSRRGEAEDEEKDNVEEEERGRESGATAGKMDTAAAASAPSPPPPFLDAAAPPQMAGTSRGKGEEAAARNADSVISGVGIDGGSGDVARPLSARGSGGGSAVAVDSVVYQNLCGLGDAMGIPPSHVKRYLIYAGGNGDLAASMLLSEAKDPSS